MVARTDKPSAPWLLCVFAACIQYQSVRVRPFSVEDRQIHGSWLLADEQESMLASANFSMGLLRPHHQKQKTTQFIVYFLDVSGLSADQLLLWGLACLGSSSP